MPVNKNFTRKIENLASRIITAAGNTLTLVMVFCLVLLWAASGFYYNFSEHWEMIISTASSVVTILMVFLIQKSQNKHSLAIQLKLNELVAASELASNRLVSVEGMTEEELKVLNKYYSKLSKFANKEENLQQTHSIDESHHEHTIKKELEEELEKIQIQPRNDSTAAS